MSIYALVIHGGAGTILKEDMTPELEQAYEDGLAAALEAGYAVLENGGSAINAVKAAIVLLGSFLRPWAPYSSPAGPSKSSALEGAQRSKK